MVGTALDVPWMGLDSSWPTLDTCFGPFSTPSGQRYYLDSCWLQLDSSWHAMHHGLPVPACAINAKAFNAEQPRCGCFDALRSRGAVRRQQHSALPTLTSPIIAYLRILGIQTGPPRLGRKGHNLKLKINGSSCRKKLGGQGEVSRCFLPTRSIHPERRL